MTAAFTLPVTIAASSTKAYEFPKGVNPLAAIAMGVVKTCDSHVAVENVLELSWKMS